VLDLPSQENSFPRACLGDGGAVGPGGHMFFPLPDLSLSDKQLVLSASVWFKKSIKKRKIVWDCFYQLPGCA